MAAVENFEKKINGTNETDIVLKLESLLVNIARKIYMSVGGC